MVVGTMDCLGRKRILLLACLTASAQCYNQQAERFPLSGGLPDGVTVTVKVGDWTQSSNNLIVDFAQPDGTVSFRFRLNGKNYKIHRSQHDGNQVVKEQSWGSMPRLWSSFEMTFTKVGKLIQVGFDGERHPWFDFEMIGDTPLLTHLFLWDGFENTEVIVARPTCSTECNARECTCDVAEDSCGKAILSSGSCADRNTTGDDAISCCSGLPPALDISVTPGTWAVTTGDLDLLKRADYAFWGHISGNPSWLGLIVKVVSVDEETHLVNVWIPALINQSSTIRFAPEVLSEKVTVGYQNVSIIHDSEMRNFDIDQRTLRVRGSNSMYRGQYVTLIHETAEREGANHTQDPWVLWINDRWNFWSSKDEGSIVVFLTDQEVEVSGCTNAPHPKGGIWMDSDGNTCQDYGDKGWCDLTGDETATWDSDKASQKYTDFSPEDWYPPRACCPCGGGSYGGTLDTFPDGLVTDTFEASQVAAASKVAYVV
jgi:hypothetical protein